MHFIPKAPALFLATAMLGACAATMPGEVPQSPSGGTCNAAPAASFVGERVNEALGARVLAATGARSLRWGPPGGAMTMDYREDRVNVFYDAQMVVERITCG